MILYKINGSKWIFSNSTSCIDCSSLQVHVYTAVNFSRPSSTAGSQQVLKAANFFDRKLDPGNVTLSTVNKCNRVTPGTSNVVKGSNPS